MGLLTGLISFWELEEASGTRVDAHGSNDLSENGGTISSATGKVGNGADLEAGSTQYLSHADNADLSTGDIDFSVLLWVKPETSTGFPVMMAKGWKASGTDREYVVYFGGFVKFGVQSASGNTEVASTIGLTDGQWHCIIAWHDSVNNVIGISVNNETAVTTAWSGGVSDTARAFWLGASPDQSLYFDGVIDQVGFWKRVLTSAERDELFNSGNGRSYASMSTTTTTLAPGAFTITGTAMSSLSFSSSGLQLLIDGVDKTALAKQRGLRLHYSIGGNWTADFVTQDQDSTASAYRPDLDEPVLVTYYGQLIHKGNITTVRDAPLAGSASGVAMSCQSKMNRVSTDQVIVTDTFAAGQTQKAIVTAVFNTHVAPYFPGIVLDPAMLDGPTIDETLTFDGARLIDVWNRITTMTGWPIRLTPNDVLESFAPGTKTAAYALTAANGLAEYIGSGGVRPVVTWEKTRGTFVNKVSLRYGQGTKQKIDSFTGNGSTNSFVLTYPLAGYIPYTTHSAVGYAVVVYNGSNESLGGPTAGLDWTYDLTTGVLSRSLGTPANGATIEITYDVQFPQTVTVLDQTSIDTVGLFHRLAPDAPDVFDLDEATALAEGYLRTGDSPKVASVYTRQYPMPLPGDVINLAFADRTIADDDYLITQVEAFDYVDDELAFRLTCVEGTELRRTWSELLRGALGV